MQIGEIEIKWLGHAGFFIKNSKVIYIDPFNIPDGCEKADFILITHSHYDHCSIKDIEKIVKAGTRIILPVDCQSKITRFNSIKIDIIHPGDELDFHNIVISVLPAYNIDKHFHPKEEAWVGYLIKMNNVTIYHAGDTDIIPEMKNLTGYDHKNNKLIALLPVGGRFTMNSEEAFESAKIIKPFLAVPMHYGTIIGTEEDANEFVELCSEENISTKILEKF